MLKEFAYWFAAQIEWVKSLFSEVLANGQLKMSHKRVISLAVIWAFIFTYIRVSWDQKSVADIPPTWAMLIAAILGLAIYANIANKDKQPNG